MLKFLRLLGQSKPSDDLYWQQVVEAGQYERHFNQLESTYRTLASTWLLATFAGIGFAIVNGKIIPFDWQLAAAFIAFLGAVGLIFVWMLDVLIYHRLLDAIFFTAREIERQHPGLPPFRRHMLRITRVGGAVQFVQLFYIAGVDTLLLIMTGFLVLAWREHLWAVALTGVWGFGTIAGAASSMWTIHRQHRMRMQAFFEIPATEPSRMLSWTPQGWIDLADVPSNR